MCSVRGVSTAARLRSWQTFVLPLVAASMLAPGSVSFGQPAVELRAKMEAAIIAAEAALVSEETRLDELAEHNVDRTLEDGTPSVGQASSNIRLWEQRIREFEAGELELREALNIALVSLDSDIKQLAQRLSVQREHAKQQITAQQRTEWEQAEQRESEKQAREQAERHESEQKRVERERAEKKETEQKAREQAARKPPSLQWLKSGGEVPRDAVIGGRLNAEPVHVCRDVLHDGIYVGVLYSGSYSGNCYVGWRGGHKRGPDFEVLTGIGETRWIEVGENFVDPRLLTADSVMIYGDEGFSVETTGGLEEHRPDPDAWYAFRGGQQANGVPIFICNADHDTGPKPGGVVDGRCHFEYSGENIKSEFHLLVVKGWSETPQDSLVRRDESLASMAVRRLEAGNLEHALNAASRMSLVEQKDQLLGRIAQAQIQEDSLQDAFGTAQLISVALLRDDTLNQVAMAHFHAGNLLEATTATLLMKTGDLRGNMLGRLVDKYRESWKLPEALDIAEQIHHDGRRRKHLYNVAMAQIKAGDYKGAMGTAQLSHAPGTDYRDKVFGRVVDKYRESWKLPEALDIAKQIRHDGWRRQHLYNVAMAQIKAGDYKGAMSTAQLSHAPGTDYRDKAFGRAVDRYREAGRLQEALSIAEQIYHDGWRRKHLHNIAIGQVDAGDQEGAKATANRIEDPQLRDKALSEIARRSR